MLTDYHCHVLPGIDDGSANPDMSLKMLEVMRSHGVERVIFTPHFYAHREKSVDNFLKHRTAAFNSISEKLPVKNVFFGAEVAIEKGISELDGIEKLAIEGTRLILLELPYTDYASWMSDEIYNIAYDTGYTPIIAHVHRYTDWYNKSQMSEILDTQAIFQVNAEAFGSFGSRRYVNGLIKNGLRPVFGSDSHNLDSRKPNFDLLKKKVSEEIINESDGILDKYMI